jgi:hypothetical protein
VPGGDRVRGCRLDGFGPVQGMAGRERLELEAAGVQSPIEQRVTMAGAADQLPVPPGCVQNLRLPGESGCSWSLLIQRRAGSAVLSVCP